MSDTPRTDASIKLNLKNHGLAAVETDFARQLERELHSASQAASDNSDWFNCLVYELSELIGCEKTPSAIIEACKLLRDLPRCEGDT